MVEKATDRYPYYTDHEKKFATNVEPPQPKWKRFIWCIPIIIFSTALVSAYSWIVITFDQQDAASMIAPQLIMKEINTTNVFQPALQRAGFDTSTTQLQLNSTMLDRIYYLSPNSFWGSTAGVGSRCITTNESIYLDFPRRLLFEATPSLVNGKVTLESPDEVVPLIPNEYMVEMFEENKAYQKAIWVFYLIANVIGYIIIICCVTWYIYDPTKSDSIGLATFVFIFSFVLLAGFGVPATILVQGKATQFLLDNYDQWGIKFSRCLFTEPGPPIDAGFAVVISTMIGGLSSLTVWIRDQNYEIHKMQDDKLDTLTEEIDAKEL